MSSADELIAAFQAIKTERPKAPITAKVGQDSFTLGDISRASDELIVLALPRGDRVVVQAARVLLWFGPTNVVV